MNKRLIKRVATAFFSFIIVASCEKKDLHPLREQSAAIQFTSSITNEIITRASGSAWDAGDSIGIFVNSAANNSPISGNKKYTTNNGDGNFTSAGSLTYPNDGSSVNFIAYYPYSSNVSNNIYKVDVSSQANLSALDLLYANNATNFSSASSAIPNLEFTHQLAMVNLTVQAGAGIDSLDGLTASFVDFNTRADFDLVTGNLSAGSNPANINAKVTGNANAEKQVTAIMLPLANASGKKILFSLPGGDTYTWTMPAGATLEKGKSFSYTIMLQKRSPQLILDINYENGTTTSGLPGVSGSVAPAADADYMVQPGATGNWAIAHKVVHGDSSYYSAEAYRSESSTVSSQTVRFEPGQERRYEFSVLLKDWTPWISGSIPETNIFQLKVSGNTGTDSGVPLQVRVLRNNLRLRYVDNERLYDIVSDVRPYYNQWIHFRIDVKWTARNDNTGYMRTYMKLPGQNNFKLADERSNYGTFAGDRTIGNIGYIKWGVYIVPVGVTRITHHDDIRVYKLD